jgi:hypothetical protein
MILFFYQAFIFNAYEVKGLAVSADIATLADGRVLLDPSSKEALSTSSSVHVTRRSTEGALTQLILRGRMSRSDVIMKMQLAISSAEERSKSVAALIPLHR